MKDILNSDTIVEVVRKLVGEIRPAGETNTDAKRLINLEVMTQVVDDLLTDIDEVATDNKNRYEDSMKKAGKFANDFLDKIGIE